MGAEICLLDATRPARRPWLCCKCYEWVQVGDPYYDATVKVYGHKVKEKVCENCAKLLRGEGA